MDFEEENEVASLREQLDQVKEENRELKEKNEDWFCTCYALEERIKELEQEVDRLMLPGERVLSPDTDYDKRMIIGIGAYDGDTNEPVGYYKTVVTCRPAGLETLGK